MKMKKKKCMSLCRIIVVFVGLLFLTQNCVGCTEINSDKFFKNNVGQLSIAAKEFAEQSNIVLISRHDSLLTGLYYHINKNYDSETDISATFEVPRIYNNNEEEYWEGHFAEIVSAKGTGSIKLAEYLKNTGMKKEELAHWRKFLKIYGLTYISKEIDGNYIYVGIDDSSGYAYKLNSTDIPAQNSVKKLDANWYYCSE